MKYLSINKENNDFGFKDNKINEILKSDIKISDKIYNRFFEEQAQGKQYKIKNLKGETFEEIFEEVFSEPSDPIPIEPSPIEKLQQENAELKKQIESTQQGMAEMMNLIAMQGITPTLK